MRGSTAFLLVIAFLATGCIPFGVELNGSGDGSALSESEARGGIPGKPRATPAPTATPAATTTPTATPRPTATPVPTLAPGPTTGAGTGTSYTPSYVTGVTGGGPMPDWTTNVVNAASYGARGDGMTDDTAALRNAAFASRDQNRPLVIPATAAFYKISGPIEIYRSVGGINGMPTIKQTNQEWNWNAEIFRLNGGMTGWVYNLRLVGTFTTLPIAPNGSNTGAPPGEWAHCIRFDGASNVTIKGNILENPKGDCVSVSYQTSNNVIIDSNTMTNPLRCGVALVWFNDKWVVTNNIITKPVPYVSAIDLETEITNGQGGYITNFELAYNKIVAGSGQTFGFSDGFAVSMWTPVGAPGGNVYLHHNWGSWPDGFLNPGSGWFNIVNTNNVAGNSVP